MIFSTPDPFNSSNDPDCAKPRQLYLRASDGTVTEVSASQRATPDPAGPQESIFQGASSDGKRVIFTSREKLSEDAGDGGHIYQYDVSTGELHALVSDVDALYKVSDDARFIYYQTPDLTFHVYRADSGSSDVIGPAPNGFVAYDGPEASIPMEISSRGDAAFVSRLQITDFDNRGYAEVYLYDVGLKMLTCVSCDPAGQRPPGSRARPMPA